MATSTSLANVFDGLNLEQVAALRPDESDRRDVSRLIGTAVGRGPQMEQAIGSTYAAITALRDRHPGLAGRTFTTSYYHAPGEPLATIDDPATTAVGLYRELGLTLAPAIGRTAVDRSLSMENLGALDVGIVVLGFATSDLQRRPTDSPLYRSIPAVAAGRVYLAHSFTSNAANNPTVLNIPWQLQQIEPVLAKTAAGSL